MLLFLPQNTPVWFEVCHSFTFFERAKQFSAILVFQDCLAAMEIEQATGLGENWWDFR